MIPRLCYIPEGAFKMGCNQAVDKDCRDDELPAHDVFLAAYFIDKHKVMVAEYRKCVKAENTAGWNAYILGIP